MTISWLRSTRQLLVTPLLYPCRAKRCHQYSVRLRFSVPPVKSVASVPSAVPPLDFRPRGSETARAMAKFTLNVNGRRQVVDVEPATPLLYVLRNDLELHGPRFGCGLGQCGACTVLIKGEAVGRASAPVSSVQGAEITTLEGLAKDGVLHPVQQAWIDEQVPQCGFCQNGQMLTAKALLDKNPNPDRRADPAGDGRHAVPLHDLLPHPGGHQARREGDVARPVDPHRRRSRARMLA